MKVKLYANERSEVKIVHAFCDFMNNRITIKKMDKNFLEQK